MNIANTSKIYKCANCKKEAIKAYFPFCSERCKNIDLHKWFSASYVIPGEKLDNSE